MAAAAATVLEAGEELECAYCFGNESEMSHPRRLPCGHVYCLKCIEDDVAANKILQCPKCRRAFDTAPKDLRKHHRGGLLDAIKPCEVCDKNKEEAKVYCITCSKKLCKSHEDSHEELLPNHKNVISIEEFSATKGKFNQVLCPRHACQPLRLICKMCLEKFCMECEDTDGICTKVQEAASQPKPVKATPTHVEIRCCLTCTENPGDVFTLIEQYLFEQLKEFCVTKFEHSYDSSSDIFRFDLYPQDIELLLATKCFILGDTPDSELVISPKYSGKQIIVQSLDERDYYYRLNKSHLKSYIGPRSKFKSSMTIQSFSDTQALIELETCSVASKLVHTGNHSLRDSKAVQITFAPGENDENRLCVSRKVEPIQQPAGSFHRIVPINKMSAMMKAKLEEAKSQAAVAEETYDRFAKECMQLMSEYTGETEVLVSAIEAARKEQIRDIDSSYAVLVTSLRKSREETQEQIASFTETKVNGKQKEIANNIKLLDTMVRDCNEVTMIDQARERTKIIKDLAAEPMPLVVFKAIKDLKMLGKSRDIECALGSPSEFKLEGK